MKTNNQPSQSQLPKVLSTKTNESTAATHPSQAVLIKHLNQSICPDTLTKRVAKTEESEAPEDPRLKNWSNLFGNYLSEELLRQRRKTPRKSTEIMIDRAYFREVPIPTVSSLWQSPSVKQNFGKFIQGEISANEFLARKNQADLLDRQKPKKGQNDKKQKLILQRYETATRRAALTTHQGQGLLKFINNKSEELIKKEKAKHHFELIRNLIEDKVSERQEEDLRQACREIKGVGILKYMYDTSDTYIEKIQTRLREKNARMMRQEKVRGASLKVIKHQNPYLPTNIGRYENIEKQKFDHEMDFAILKNEIDKNAKQYLSELEVKHFYETERVKKKIFVDYQFRRVLTKKKVSKNDKHIIPYSMNQQVQSAHIDKDLEMIKYISNMSTGDQTKEKLNQVRAAKLLLKIQNSQLFDKQTKKTTLKLSKENKIVMHNQPISVMTARSCDDSLCSIFESNVDTLYQQSKQAQEKLVERKYTDGFSKTVRAIQKNEQLRLSTVEMNVDRLKVYSDGE